MTLSRTVLAHRKHPQRAGRSLCGESSKIKPCPACERIHLALQTVHVQSDRSPTHAYCGLALAAGPDGVAPAYITGRRARSVLGACDLPLHALCVANLTRADQATEARRALEDDFRENEE